MHHHHWNTTSTNDLQSSTTERDIHLYNNFVI